MNSIDTKLNLDQILRYVKELNVVNLESYFSRLLREDKVEDNAKETIESFVRLQRTLNKLKKQYR